MDGLETDLRGTAQVVRLDLFSPDGSAFFRDQQLGSVPVLVVLDPTGTVRYRANGLPNTDQIRQAVRALAASP